MGCDKDLLIRLLAEFLAALIYQFVGCSVGANQLFKRIKLDQVVVVMFSPQGPSNVGNVLGSGFEKAGKEGDDSSTVSGIGSLGGLFGKESKKEPKSDAPYDDTLTYALAWGGGVLAATHIFRLICGAHINPCVTIAALICKKIKIVDSLLYILMQLLGSAFGFGLAYALFDITPEGVATAKTGEFFCLTGVALYPWWKGLILELFLTAGWVFAMCASWHSTNETLIETVSLRIGFVVTACCLVGGPLTGASMNPFRTLWGAVLGMYFQFIYVYMLAPLLGAVLFALLWRFVFCMGDNKEKEVEDEGL